MEITPEDELVAVMLELMTRSSEAHGFLHLRAHKKVTEFLSAALNIHAHQLSQKEKVIITAAIYLTLNIK